MAPRKDKRCKRCLHEPETHPQVRCPYCGHHTCAHQSDTERSECKDGRRRMAAARRPEDRNDTDWESLR